VLVEPPPTTASVPVTALLAGIKEFLIPFFSASVAVVISIDIYLRSESQKLTEVV
jgi:hypothetical protein